MRLKLDPPKRVRIMLVACLAALALGASACGSSSGGSSSGSSSGSSASSGSGVPQKTIAYAQLVGNESEIAARESEAVKLATEALGWKMIYIQGAGELPKMVQGINAAINGGANAVLIASTDAPLVQPSLALAKRKGVPVIATGGGAEPSSQFAAQYQESEQKMSKLLTEGMIKEIGANGTVAVLDNTQISAGKFRQQAREEVLKSNPNIKTVAREEVELANLTGGAKQSTSAMLTRFPQVNALWVVYDAMMPAALEALNQRHDTTTKVYSWFANPSNVETMRKNPNVKALIDGDLDHSDLIAIDQLARHFKNGTALDPEALKKCGMKYEVVTREKLPPKGKIFFPVPADTQPFIENWKAGKFGEGADCGP